MELQWQLPSSMEFDFNSGRTSPCGSSPSTPKGFGNNNYYFSAPPSPAQAIGIYCEVEQITRGDASTSEKPFLSMKTDSKLQHKLEGLSCPLLSPHSTKLQHKKSFWSAFSPKRKKESEPEKITVDSKNEGNRTKKKGRERTRERERASAFASGTRSGRRAIRSLSPPRESKYSWEQYEQLSSSAQNNTEELPMTTSSALTLASTSKGSKKWKLKDLFLFRSASEGRASEKDLLKKYSYLHRKQEVATNRNPRSESTQGSTTGLIVPARRGPISAHELHYTVNKAVSQDMRKKSFLPYKQGILGQLAINPTVHALAHGYAL